MSVPTISQLTIYPIKSLDPIFLSEAEIGIHSLLNDRSFAMIDTEGKYINGKRTPRVHLLKTTYSLSKSLVTFSDRNNEKNSHVFELKEGNTELDQFLSDFFDTPLRLVRSDQGDFMDAPKKSGITLVSDASLISLQQDLNTTSFDDLRLRFRANVEITGVDAYWEEKLFTTPGEGVHFKLGNVEMIGVRPCPRCNVPPRDPHTGVLDKTFAKKMMLSRKRNLPSQNTLLSHGKNTYYLSVNVYIPTSQKGKKIAIGDTLNIIKTVSLEGLF
ncbi:MOSC domain-containing protein [Aquimarina rhabdastrellae]